MRKMNVRSLPELGQMIDKFKLGPDEPQHFFRLFWSRVREMAVCVIRRLLTPCGFLAVAFSRWPVSQGSAQLNNERIARDLRVIDCGIPSCQIASHRNSVTSRHNNVDREQRLATLALP
jgi:hypothetical protein